VTETKKAKKKVLVRSSEAMLFRDGPVPVYIMPNTGVFAVFYQGKWQTRSSLGAIDNLIAPSDKVAYRVPVTRVDAGFVPSGSPASHTEYVVVTVKGFNLIKEDGRPVYGYDDVVLFDAKAIAKLDAIAAEQKALEKEFARKYRRLIDRAEKVIAGMKKVTSGNVAEVAESLKKAEKKE
jgi:hypothetical protein